MYLTLIFVADSADGVKRHSQEIVARSVRSIEGFEDRVINSSRKFCCCFCCSLRGLPRNNKYSLCKFCRRQLATTKRT